MAEQRYQKLEPLTYASDKVLKVGTIVRAPYGKKVVAGFVHAKSSQPTFKTKEIEEDLPVIIPLALRNLHTWMLEFYPAGSGSVTQLFVPSDIKLVAKKSENIKRHSEVPPALTTQQKEVIEQIESSEKSNFLLHGETGSGKTRLYIERSRSYLDKGKSVIILTPEISLIPQLVEAFTTMTNYPVLEFHSGLTKTKRNKNWLDASLTTEPTVVIGTRSAIFVPLSDVGLIAVDEMHEPAYKQDAAPRYHGLRAAAKRAQLQQTEIIYGSATPPVTEYFMAQHSKVPVLRLTSTAKKSVKPGKHIIDIKDKSLFSRNRYLSDSLLDAITENLQKKEQSLLFLNRRGTARQVLCQNCGWQALCPKCDLPLTFHADTHQVRCHTCGYHTQPPFACPSCQSSEILYRSLGTKALADDLQRLFPEAKIGRFDTDNNVNETLTRNFADIHSGKVDILIGTQMLGKGLDLPHLTLVGIVNADTALHMPDFSSAERGYQLLHQAIGRVGRGHKAGRIIIQTFQPSDPLVQAAANQTWQALYEHEIAERRQYLFPPFCHLLKITVSRRTSLSAENFIQGLAKEVRRFAKRAEIEEPSPSFHERSHGKYNWQLVIKARDRRELTAIVSSLPSGDYIYDLDPIHLL